MADKADMRKGIQQVQSRLRIQKDGRARLYIAQGALTHAPDAKLRAKGKPTSTIEEMRSYVWNPRKDCPEDANNHGADSLRYVTVHVESAIGGWGIR